MSPAIVKSLSPQEQAHLVAHERVIRKGLKTFADVGRALCAIRDGRLYREQYGTFEAYCSEQWQMSKTHANRLVESAKVIDNLTPVGAKPTSERQARPLAKLDPSDQPAAWQAAQDAAKGKGRPVTAQDVQAAVETLTRDKEPATEWDFGDGEPDADAVWQEWQNLAALTQKAIDGLVSATMPGDAHMDDAAQTLRTLGERLIGVAFDYECSPARES